MKAIIRIQTNKMKVISAGIAGVVALAALIWGISYMFLEHKKEFQTKFADADRRSYEETKSYVHGKTQELSKLYDEFRRAESSDNQKAVKAVVKMKFSEFDESNIKNETLKQFLINSRGY